MKEISLSLDREDKKVLAFFLSVSGIGSKTIQKILHLSQIKRFKITSIWQNFHHYWQDIGIHQGQYEAISLRSKLHTPETYWEKLQQQGITVLMESDSTYPQLLRKISDRPPVLFVKGNTSFWNTLPIAVVGTRQITAYGREVTRKLVHELIHVDATIISGFMYGVDAVAHEETLAAQGRSVAVLGYGFDICYPRHFRRFLEAFLAAGNVCVTEYAPNVQPRPGTFLQRNRIVAGMSLAVLVTEATGDSGSIHTARIAKKYGRAVCAASGPITSPYAYGVQKILNEGGKLVLSGQDIVKQIHQNEFMKNTHFDLSPIEKTVYTCLRKRDLLFAEIQEQTHIQVSELHIALTHLEMKGYLTRFGAFWRAKKEEFA